LLFFATCLVLLPELLPLALALSDILVLLLVLVLLAPLIFSDVLAPLVADSRASVPCLAVLCILVELSGDGFAAVAGAFAALSAANALPASAIAAASAIELKFIWISLGLMVDVSTSVQRRATLAQRQMQSRGAVRDCHVRSDPHC
jgi:hypothetical protein